MIGGAEIYRPRSPAPTSSSLTEVELDVPGDTFFPAGARDGFDEVARDPHVVGGRDSVRVRHVPAARGGVSGAHVGTSGWGYPSWQPGFYPAGLDRTAFLSFYAERLSAVELNATKYRLPSAGAVPRLGEQVPDGFRFAVKAPDRIERRLDAFEARVRALGDRLGCVRVVVERPRDDGFLELLLGSADPGVRYALDLRDPTWDGVEERLARPGRCASTTAPGGPGWAYLRYRELRYSDEELARIAGRAPRSCRRRDRGLRLLPPRRRAGRARRGHGDAAAGRLESGS